MTDFNLERIQIESMTAFAKVLIMALVEALEVLSPVVFSRMNGFAKALLVHSRT